MTMTKLKPSNIAISRPAIDVGTTTCHAPERPVQDVGRPLQNAELVRLRSRVVALENAMVALLSEATEPQRQRVREMAAYISPRPGFTRHPVTIRAAALMVNLKARAARYKSAPPSVRRRVGFKAKP